MRIKRVPPPPVKIVSLGARTARLRATATAAAREHPDRWALIAIAAAVILANLLYLFGIFDPNPLGTQSQLGISATHGFLGGTNTIDPNIGYTSQALGHRAALDLLHFQPPWWNPYEATGVPLASEMQSAALFPPTLLLVFANGQVYEHVLLELVAGFATYLLLRRIEVRRLASTAGAIAFALNGTFAWFGHAAFNPVAFLPLLLLGVELAYDATIDDRSGGWWLIAVAGALSVYAGFPETAYVDGMLAVAWLAWRCGCAGRRRMRVLIGKAAAGAIAGALLAAPILIPFLAYLPYADVGHHAGSETLHLPAQALPQLILPYVYGPIFEFHDPAGVLAGIWGSVGGYITMSLVLFGMLGLASRGRRGLRLVLAAWLLLAIARIYDEPPGLGQLLSVVPGILSVQFERFAMPSVELAVVVLAALGLDQLGGALVTRRRTAIIGLCGLVIVGVAVIGASGLVDSVVNTRGRYHYFALAGVGEAIVVILGTGVALLWDPRARVRLACALVVAEAVAMFMFPQLSGPRNVRTDFAAVAYLRQHLGMGRFFTLGPIQPNYGAYFGVASLNDNDIPLPSAFAAYVGSSLDPFVEPTVFVGTKNGGRPASAPSPEQELIAHLSGYRAAGVDYVLTPPQTSLPSPFKLVFRNSNTWIYRLSGAAPFFTASAAACAVRPLDPSAVRISCPTPAVLVRRETYMRGWSAQIDGRSVPVRKTGGLFQAVSVRTGSHLITFGYAPPGIGLAVVAFAIGGAWLLIGVRRSSRQLAPAQPHRPRIESPARYRPSGSSAPAPTVSSPALAATARSPAPAATASPTRTATSDDAATNGVPRIQVGRVEKVESGTVTGWAWCPAAPAWRIGIRAILDGEDAGRVVADLPRPSLAQAGIGDGRHGFRLPMVAGDASSDHHTLRIETDSGFVLASASSFTAGSTLSGGELALDDSPGGGGQLQVVGFIEEVTAECVSGWAWWPAIPEARLAVWAIVDGQEVAMAVAGLPRPSLVTAGVGDGRYGFRIQLPGKSASAKPRSLRVETDQGIPLPRSVAYRHAAPDREGRTFGAAPIE